MLAGAFTDGNNPRVLIRSLYDVGFNIYVSGVQGKLCNTEPAKCRERKWRVEDTEGRRGLAPFLIDETPPLRQCHQPIAIRSIQDTWPQSYVFMPLNYWRFSSYPPQESTNPAICAPHIESYGIGTYDFALTTSTTPITAPSSSAEPI